MPQHYTSFTPRALHKAVENPYPRATVENALCVVLGKEHKGWLKWLDSVQLCLYVFSAASHTALWTVPAHWLSGIVACLSFSFLGGRKLIISGATDLRTAFELPPIRQLSYLCREPHSVLCRSLIWYLGTVRNTQPWSFAVICIWAAYALCCKI